MDTKKEITQELLKSLFEYDPNTGNFVRLKGVQRSKKGSIAGSYDYRKYGSPYWTITINGTYCMAHRLAWLYMYGYNPDGQIDHIDGNPLNNRIDNLRVVSSLQNCMNKRRYSSNTSGVNGVSWDSKKNKWEVQIMDKKVKKRIGRFKSLLDAVCARKNANRLYGYDANHGNERVINSNAS